MSTGLYSHTTRATGTVLTAAIYNADHQNHITNANPSQHGGYSDNLSQFQTITDPGGLGTESLAANIAGELERIRFAIKRICGTSQWYVAPATNLASVGGALTDLTVSETVNFTGDLSPAQITSNQNNYAPSGHADAFRFRVNSDAARDITGLAGGASGRIVVFTNIGSFSIRFTNDDAASTAANRFLLGANLTIFPSQSISLQYDNTSSRWRPVSTSRPDYGDFPEISAPASPPTDVARLYAKDVSGTTRLAYKDSAGAETVLTAAVGGTVEIRTSSATITIPTGMTKLRITMVGGGGGGGGTAGIACCATYGAAGSGGPAGGVMKVLTGLTPGNTLSLTIGAAGTGGAAGNNAGGNGGDTILASGTETITTLTASKGSGGGGNPGSGNSANGAVGTGTNGDINVSGGMGINLGGATLGGSILQTGDVPFGLGALMSSTFLGSANGTAASGKGGGGGGGATTGAATRSGGAGSAGVAIFEWFAS